jgi:hypothetical protein
MGLEPGIYEKMINDDPEKRPSIDSMIEKMTTELRSIPEKDKTEIIETAQGFIKKETKVEIKQEVSSEKIKSEPKNMYEMRQDMKEAIKKIGEHAKGAKKESKKGSYLENKITSTLTSGCNLLHNTGKGFFSQIQKGIEKKQETENKAKKRLK